MLGMVGSSGVQRGGGKRGDGPGHPRQGHLNSEITKIEML